MSAPKHLTPSKLRGKVIDVHSHVGVSLKSFARMEYPYAQTIEGLAYRQRAGGVDVNVVFPLGGDLYFDPNALMAGERVPSRRPLSPAPYATENMVMMREVFSWCAHLADRFLPFVCVDPGRAVGEQIGELEALDEQFPIYGVKVNPVGCQSRAIELLAVGEALLDFAQARDLPLLFHAVTWPEDEYSQASDILKIAERRPALRFCLAHCVLFHRATLERADAMPNVWVDTAAMKIQVEMVRRDAGRSMPVSELLEGDYADYLAIMETVCERFPDTMLWGTDSPAYAYIARRKQGEGRWREFQLEGTYEDEVAALNRLRPDVRMRVANCNTLRFLFGEAGR